MSFRGRVARVLRTVANGRRSVTIGAELPEWYGSRLYSSLMLWAQGGPKYGFLAENDYGTGLLLGQGTEGQPARATLTVWPDSISLAGPKGADPERALLTTGYTSAVDGIGEAGATSIGSFWITTREISGSRGSPSPDTLQIKTPVSIVDGARTVALGDTGWLDFPLVAAYATGNIARYRRLNGVVEVAVDISGTSFPGGSLTNVSDPGAIPNGFMPSTRAAGVALGGPISSILTMRVNTNGQVQIFNHTASAVSGFAARVMYSV